MTKKAKTASKSKSGEKSIWFYAILWGLSLVALVSLLDFIDMKASTDNILTIFLSIKTLLRLIVFITFGYFVAQWNINRKSGKKK
jgi:hypothetical protein